MKRRGKSSEVQQKKFDMKRQKGKENVKQKVKIKLKRLSKSKEKVQK